MLDGALDGAFDGALEGALDTAVDGANEEAGLGRPPSEDPPNIPNRELRRSNGDGFSGSSPVSP